MKARQDQVPRDDPRSLAGVRIGLMTSYSPAQGWHFRFAREINALQDAGVEIHCIASESEALPQGMVRHVVVSQRRRHALSQQVPASSSAKWRPMMIAQNLVFNWARRLLSTKPAMKLADLAFGQEFEDGDAARTRLLDQMADEVDLFWVQDFPNLKSTCDAARRAAAPVLYETCHLLPEIADYVQEYGGCNRALAVEAECVRYVKGFITSCDSYADYYVERYGGLAHFRRPIVVNNSPDQLVSHIRTTGDRRTLLRMGSFSSPVILTVIRAMALARSGITLTLQGSNFLGSAPQDLINELGLGDRVRLLERCKLEDVVDIAAEYDVGLDPLRGLNENNRRAQTAKVFTYMAAGLAVVASDNPGAAQLINKHRNGLLVSENTPHAWAAAFDAIQGMSASELDQLKRRSLDAAAGYTWAHDRPLFLGEFIRMIEDGA